MTIREAIARAIDPYAWGKFDTFQDKDPMIKNAFVANSLRKADRALDAISGEGCAIVPIKPTDSMIEKGLWAGELETRVDEDHEGRPEAKFDGAREVWEAMLNEAPKVVE